MTNRSTGRPTQLPLLWLALTFGAGAASGALLTVDPVVPVSVAGACGVLAFLGRGRTFASLFLLAAFAALGAFAYQLETASVSDDRIRRYYDEGRVASGDPVEIEGTIAAALEPTFDGAAALVEVSGLRLKGETLAASGRVRLYVSPATDEARADLDSLALRYGTKVRVACRVLREDAFLDPGVTPTRELLDRQGIDATCPVKSPLLIEITEAAPRSVLGTVFDLRRYVLVRARSLFDAPTAGVLAASTLGDKYLLDRNTAETFREGGTFHVLVISGLHITFLGGLIFLFVRRWTKNRWTQFAVVTAVLSVYAIAVGGEAPVVRATAMFTFVLLGRALYRNMTLLNALGASSLALLAWRPSDVLDPSFQLTFVSVGAITAMALPLIDKARSIGEWMPTKEKPFPPNVPSLLKFFCEVIYWNPAAWEIYRKQQVWSIRHLPMSPLMTRLPEFRLPRAAALVFEGLIVSLAVQIWMLPLAAFYFHRVPFASVLLNLWVGPVLAVEILFAGLSLIAAEISLTAAAPLVEATEALNWLLVSVPAIFVSGDTAGMRMSTLNGPHAGIYFAYFIPLVALALVINRWDPFALKRPGRGRSALALLPASAAAAFMASWILFPPEPLPDGKLTVRFLDVGQGDAVFVTFPNGETMLLDGGGQAIYRTDEGSEEGPEPDRPRIGEMVTSRVLWNLGVRRIDHLAASHADTDHMQGLVDAARNFAIGHAYFAAVQGSGADESELGFILERRDVPTTRLRGDELLTIGGVKVTVLHPLAGADAGMSENDRSLVLLLEHGATRVLLAGDIEAAAEEKMLERGLVAAANVVKVPHHGSRTSSSAGFVNATRPQIAVISAGRRSKFGHPHERVVEAWQAAGATVVATGRNGMITVISDGTNISVESFR